MAINPFDQEIDPPYAATATAYICDALELHGYRPTDGEPDSRPLPSDAAIAGAMADIMDAFISTFADTRLEADLEDLLWSSVNLVHRTVERAERALDDNEQAQRQSQREQDGSEVRSVELERLLAEGQTLLERRDLFEQMRDTGADIFKVHMRKPWRPRAGSIVNHQKLTSAVVDSRDFINARRRATAEVLMPQGPKIAFAGGIEYQDHRTIWAKLDAAYAKHPDMVLLHGGSPKGAELIAAKWADCRKVSQIAFKPDWTRHAKAAPFKRNEAMLDVLPIGVIIAPGSGIHEQLARRAREKGIPIWKLGL